MKRTLRRLIPVFLLITSILLTGCKGPATPVVTGAPSDAAETAASTGTVAAATPEPTATQAPAAARVNGEPLLLADYEAELARFQAAQADPSVTPGPEQRLAVLDSLVDQVMLAQAARKAEYVVDELDAGCACPGTH